MFWQTEINYTILNKGWVVLYGIVLLKTIKTIFLDKFKSHSL